MKALPPFAERGGSPTAPTATPITHDVFAGAGVLVALAVGALCAAIGIVVSLAGLS